MLFLAYLRVQSDFSSWLENKKCLVLLGREESMRFWLLLPCKRDASVCYGVAGIWRTNAEVEHLFMKCWNEGHWSPGWVVACVSVTKVYGMFTWLENTSGFYNPSRENDLWASSNHSLQRCLCFLTSSVTAKQLKAKVRQAERAASYGPALQLAG